MLPAGALNLRELEELAREKLTAMAYGYYASGALEEVTLRENIAAWARLPLHYRVLVDVSNRDLSTTVLGTPVSMPVLVAPTAFHKLVCPDGELATARAASRAGTVMILSSLSNTRVEEVCAAAEHGPVWFQLYVYRDRAAGADLAARAKAAGFEALLVAVDAPVSGARLRDKRNGFAIPPALTLKSMADISLHPAWWMNLLTTEPLKFASFASWDRTVGELMDYLLDPTMTIADLEWMRSIWAGPLVIKGIQTVEDARRVVDAGADAVVLSNHGGRQLDRAPVPLRLVPDVVGAVGDRAEVYVDTGIMSGADIAAAVALGATGALVGRAYLYGLMAGGEQGVDRAAEILTSELIRTMQLLGASDVSELGPQHVRLP
jgi:L-lactate dehydrogenase (cytochrome)